MNENQLQNLIRDVVRAVLQEKGLAPGTSSAPRAAFLTRTELAPPAPVPPAPVPPAAVRARLLVAVCCGDCVSDAAQAALDALKAKGFALTQADEEEFKKRAPREKLVASHDAVLMPAVGDDDAAKMALGIFDEPVARVALTALATGKPLLAAMHAPYEDALKTRSPVLHRVFEEHRRALLAYGFEIINTGQIAPLLLERFRLPGEVETGLANAVAPPSGGKRKLITAGDVEAAARNGGKLQLPPAALITPLARDRARELGIELK